MSLIQMSFSGAVMILAIWLVRVMAINRLPKKAFVLLWEVVFLRLLIPISVPSVYSAYSMVRENHLTQETFTEGAVSYLIPEAQEVQFAATANMLETVRHEMSAVPSPAPFPLWTVIWAAGMAICAVFFLISYYRCYREFKMSFPVDNVFVKEWLEERRIRRDIRIRQSDRISSPLTYGVFCPVILMPKTTDWDQIQRLQYILLHEYIHIRRFDMIRKLAAVLVLCIHWFNPAVWLMYLLYHRDIELSCDESVIRKFGESSKPAYAKALIAMEEKRNHLQPLSSSFSKNAIEERIRAVMKTRKATVLAAIASTAVIAAIIVVFATSARTEGGEGQNRGKLEVGEDVAAFADTITEDMLKACGEYPSEEAYWNEPIVLLAQRGRSALYGISANGQEAMLYYDDSGEKILIGQPFRNLYQERPELYLSDIDNDGRPEVVINLRTVTGNIRRYALLVCDRGLADAWDVYLYDDFLKDVEEAVRWQYDGQNNSLLFLNGEGVILSEHMLPEWSSEYPFAGNVNYNDDYDFDVILMRLSVRPRIEMEDSFPYIPCEMVFQVCFEDGDFSLGSYYIQDIPDEMSSQGTEPAADMTEEAQGTSPSVSEYVDRYIILTDDTEIERWEIIDHNGENILRIRVGYCDENLRGTIQGHKEDCFIFMDGDGGINQVLYVEYDDKHIGYACDYRVHFEDVTFDGEDDLLIWLGDGRYSSYYCAFLYEDGQYRYEKSFEEIPSYRVDTENLLIRGWLGNNASEETDYVYEYRDGEFVLISEDHHLRDGA